MTMRNSVLTALAGCCLSAMTAVAVPQVAPTYTFCEVEDNDLCQNAQVLDASVAVAMGGAESVRDCFYLTGKLQEDCVWDIQPKCAMRVYDKPAPCRTSTGQVIAGSFYEPIVRSSNGEDLLNVVPLSDRTIRLGVAALMDAFDGTINGLSGNGAHHESGEVTVKVFYNGGDGQPRGGTANQSYVFRFKNWSDALRVAFVIPPGIGSVDIQCCNNTGQTPLCYDVDNYLITNLIPSKGYCVEVIGGLNPECDPTNTVLGVFDKNCNLEFYNDDKDQHAGYSKVCAFSEVDGSLRFAVSGGATSTVTVVTNDMGGDFGEDPDSITRDVVIDAPGVVDGTFTVCFTGLQHDYAGDVKIKLVHVETGTKVVVVNQPGNSSTTPGSPFGADGASTDLNGDYCFGDAYSTDFNQLATSLDNDHNNNSTTEVPSGNYAPWEPLSAFNGESLAGTWRITLCDLFPEACDGSVVSVAICYGSTRPGDFDFNGLKDDTQQRYFDLLRDIRIIAGLNYTYRQGASTKDDSVALVNRYPRSIWDPPSVQNPTGQAFLDRFGGAPEAYFPHMICGGYCIKVQLAEHVDTRPSFPPAGVMSGARADMNSDGTINSADLALLLSYWGVVN